MLGMDQLSRFLERRGKCSRFLAIGDRIAACSRDLPDGQRSFSSLGKRHKRNTAQSDIAATTVNDRSQHPAFRTGPLDDQI